MPAECVPVQVIDILEDFPTMYSDDNVNVPDVNYELVLLQAPEKLKPENVTPVAGPYVYDPALVTTR